MPEPRAIVRLLKAQNLPARNVSAMNKRADDLRVTVGEVERSVEVECRDDGLRQLYDWLDGRDMAHGREPLVVLPLAAEVANRTAV